MNRHRNHPSRRVRNPAYREVFERLDAALAQNTASDNREKIHLLRQAAFADVDELERSGKVIIPK